MSEGWGRFRQAQIIRLADKELEKYNLFSDSYFHVTKILLLPAAFLEFEIETELVIVIAIAR